MNRPGEAAGARRSEFDAAGFGSAVAAGRTRHGLTTRELARRAGISQAYVVTLERGRAQPEGGFHRPTPTVATVVALAGALEVDPHWLFEQGLRPAARHVFLVVGDGRVDVLRAARRAGGPGIRWLWAASSTAGMNTGEPADCVIDLRREQEGQYEPAVIVAALARELRAVGSDEASRDLGIVFADTSTVLAANPPGLLEFEHRWGANVAAAATSADVAVALNVCVYPVGALRVLSDPPAAALDLVSSHNEVWYLHGGRRSSGEAAVSRLGASLLPAGASRRRWVERAAARLVPEAGVG